MNNSILDDIKKILEGFEDFSSFDKDLIMHINTVLFTLNQMGIGKENFHITSDNEKWSDFLKEDQINLHALKSFVALKVRLLFDPPTSGVLMEAINSNLKELEWRLYITENYN